MTTVGATAVFFVILFELVLLVLVLGFGVLLVEVFRFEAVALLLVGRLVCDPGLRTGVEAVFVFVPGLLTFPGDSFLGIVVTFAVSAVRDFDGIVLTGVDGPFLLCVDCFGLAVD